MDAVIDPYRFAVVVCGYIGSERYLTREAAQREADRLNEESDEELGYEVWGDGAASVIEVESRRTRNRGEYDKNEAFLLEE